MRATFFMRDLLRESVNARYTNQLTIYPELLVTSTTDPVWWDGKRRKEGHGDKAGQLFRPRRESGGVWERRVLSTMRLGADFQSYPAIIQGLAFPKIMEVA